MATKAQRPHLPAFVLPGQPLAPFSSSTTSSSTTTSTPPAQSSSSSSQQPSSSTTNYIPGPGTHIHNGHITASIAGKPIITPAPVSANENVAAALAGRPQGTATTAESADSTAAKSKSRGKGNANAPKEDGRRREALSVLAVPGSNQSNDGAQPTFDDVRSTQPPLPSVGATVLGRVRRLERMRATVDIVAVDGVAVAGAGAGVGANGVAGPAGGGGGGAGGGGDDVCWTGTVRVQDVRATEVDKVKLGEAFRVGDLIRAEVNSLGDQSSYYLTTARNELGVVMATSEAGNSMYPISWKEFRDPITGKTETRKVAKPF